MLRAPAFDHLVIAVPNLEQSVEQCEAILGVRPVSGGAHPGLGTANALLGLDIAPAVGRSSGFGTGSSADGLTYLEILGPDPEQDPALAAQRLSGITAPTVQRWAVRPDDFDALVAAAAESRAPRVDLGEVHDMTRRTPDGELLDWRLTRRTSLAWSGIQPFLIDWKDSEHPAAREMPRITLERLWATTDDPEAIRDVLGFFGIALDVEEGETDGPHARLKGPGGSWTL